MATSPRERQRTDVARVGRAGRGTLDTSAARRREESRRRVARRAAARRRAG
jgi:hypothetical protein